MKEGTYPQDECLSTVSNPKAGSLCQDAALGRSPHPSPWPAPPVAVSCRGCWHWVVGPKSGGGTGSTCFCFHKVFVGFFLSNATWIQVFAC